MPSLVEIREELRAKRDELHAIFVEAGPEMDMEKVVSLGGDSAAKAAEIRRRNEEMGALGAEEARLAHAEMIFRENEREREREREPVPGLRHPAGNGVGHGLAPFKHAESLRDVLVGSKSLRALRDGHAGAAAFDLPVYDFKTLVTLTNISPQAVRQPPVNMALEERTVADLFLQGTVDRGVIEYYEETTVTNNAATVAEGGTKPESALGWTLRTEQVRKVATNIPATKESLDDVSFLESQISGRLSYMVRRVEERQVLGGNGSGTNLLGVLNRSGVQTQAKGADPTPDTVYKAMQKIRGAAGLGFAEPTAYVTHPNDWTDIKLLRTADGIYIWGAPATEGPDTIWGLPVRQTTEIAEGTGLVGAFRPWGEVFRREGVTVTMSNEHSTFFVENKVMIQAESRLALAIYRPAAFCTCTGI